MDRRHPTFAAALSFLLLGLGGVFFAAAALGVYLARLYRTVAGGPTGCVAHRGTSERRRRRARSWLGVLLTLGLVALHLEFHRHAGALWRDEVNSVNVATLPSSPTFRQQPSRFVPVLWVTSACVDVVGPRRSDAACGISVSRRVGDAAGALVERPAAPSRAPLVTLLLFGMSPTVIIYGDEVRGYGLGALGLA